jgi:hypothetical protein
MTNVHCNVNGCRFNMLHVTYNHKCGNCGEFGHGQIECGNHNQIEVLRQYQHDIMPNNKWCNNIYCMNRDTHTSEAHICTKCSNRHFEVNCIIQSYDVAMSLAFPPGAGRPFNRIISQLLQLNNVYASFPGGMGSTIVVRCKDGILDTIFMHQDSWGQYDGVTEDLETYNKFIDGMSSLDNYMDISSDNENENENENDGSGPARDNDVIQCPICRTMNTLDEIFDIKGSEDKCPICMDSNVEKFLSKCFHAPCCAECFEKLKEN